VNSKRWIKVWAIIIIIIIIPIVGGFNYLIDPYELYNTNYFDFKKNKQSNKIRLIKVFKTKEIKPTSICLGTSRTEYGYDPIHKYFTKPSYNLATSSSSMYENMLYFKYALNQGKLKKVLLVVDYRMFNESRQKENHDFETYFENKSIYDLLFSINVLKDSLLTIIGGDSASIYLENGQREHNHNWKNILKDGGHLEVMKKDEKNYYKDYPTNYTYKDTNKKSFPDFEKIVKLSYENNIELDIIFGPSHIRQWEALNYYLGYEKWLQWKKDVVLSVNKIANQQNKKQFRIMDFSVYHKLTAEKVPTNKDTKMQYHWESSHYKNELGLIVLDRLVGDSEFNNFGVELNLDNIDEHLKQQEINRHNFIDVEKYQIEVFGKLKFIKKGN
jgi:hypothetical protein